MKELNNKKDSYQLWLDKRHIELQNKFIEDIKSYVGENYYDFSQLNYINRSTPVKLIIKENSERRQKEENNFISKLENKFGKDRFDYSLLNFINISTPIKLICKKCDNMKGYLLMEIPYSYNTV